MAAKLKNLHVTKVDFVDEGANPDADIKLFKRKDVASDEQFTGADVEKGNGNILKKLLGFIGRAAGMDPEEIDSAVDEIQKGDSASFNEKINEVNNRKIADEMWDTCYALQSSLCSILNDEEMDSASASAAMQGSLDEFYAVVKDSIANWTSGKTSSIVKKDAEVTETDLEVMKSAVERLNGLIEKAAKMLDKKKEKESDGAESKDQEGEEKEMKIDKSKLTDAEKAFLESIEKRYGTEESGDMPAPAPGLETGQPTLAEPLITKSMTQNTSVETPVSQEEENSIYKGLHPAVVAEIEELRKFRQTTEDMELSNIAKKYEMIGKKPEELVPLFKSLKAAGGTAYDDMVAILDQTLEAVEKSGLFSEIGKSGHGGSTDGSAWGEAEVKAVEVMKSKPGLTKAQALDEVFLADPELAERCEKED